MSIAELMTTRKVTCSPSTTLDTSGAARAAQLMWEHDCGAIHLTDERGRTGGDRDRSRHLHGRVHAEQSKLLPEVPRKVLRAAADEE